MTVTLLKTPIVYPSWEKSDYFPLPHIGRPAIDKSATLPHYNATTRERPLLRTGGGCRCCYKRYSLFRKQVEHFCAKLELYSMQTQFSYGTLLSGP